MLAPVDVWLAKVQKGVKKAMLKVVYSFVHLPPTYEVPVCNKADILLKNTLIFLNLTIKFVINNIIYE